MEIIEHCFLNQAYCNRRRLFRREIFLMKLELELDKYFIILYLVSLVG